MGNHGKSAQSASKKRKSLVDSLFTSTQQSVLGLLFGQTHRKFFGAEIIGLARKGSGAVQRELASLVECGLVTVESFGKQKHYQANSRSPIFSELRGIILKTVGLKNPISDALSAFDSEIELALIYGSVAKGSDTAESDVDLLIVSDTLGLEALYEALQPVELQIARPINTSLYTPAEVKKGLSRKNHFLSQILSAETLLLVGDPSDYRKA